MASARPAFLKSKFIIPGVVVLLVIAAVAATLSFGSNSKSAARSQIHSHATTTEPASTTTSLATTTSVAANNTVVSGTLPMVTGNFGQTPKVTFPNAAAPKQLIAKVVHKGNGPVVKKGDLLIADYEGLIWRGQVFDSSYARHVAAGFPIGVNRVIPGWDKTLVGARIGSRMMLVVPPVDGYGAAGNSKAGIKGTDTIVFVVDLVAAYGKDAKAPGHATFLKNTVDGVTVHGAVGTEPKIVFAKGSKPRRLASFTMLDRGNGPKVQSGLVVIEYLQATWGTNSVQSTWAAGQPFAASVGKNSGTPVLDFLVKDPIGSRILLEVPANGGNPAYAVVVDIVAQPPGAVYNAK